jgi:hypothetical protein
LPAALRLALRFCTRLISRKQISKVPPTAIMNAVNPLIWRPLGRRPKYRRLARQ